MKRKIAYSSETYLIKISDVLSLEKSKLYKGEEEVLIAAGALLKNRKETLYAGEKLLLEAQKKGEEYYPVRFVYRTMNPFLGMFVGLFKPLKKRFYEEGIVRFHMRLDDILRMNLKRGQRNESNAYNWKNKKWAMSEEERSKRYHNLYHSLKVNGYNDNSPIFVMFNRSLGVRDQLFQGHHRLNICEELGIKELTVTFWTSVTAPRFMKIFDYIVAKIKGQKL